MKSPFQYNKKRALKTEMKISGFSALFMSHNIHPFMQHVNRQIAENAFIKVKSIDKLHIVSYHSCMNDDVLHRHSAAVLG